MDVSLVMFKGDGTRRDFPIKKDRLVIGRKPTCDLRIPLSSVSREHCAIELDGEAVRVRDLGSSNGTFHNSERVQEQGLAAGDELTVGPVVFTVVIDGEPSEIEPVRTVVGEQPAGKESAEASAVHAAAADDDEEVAAELVPAEDDEPAQAPSASAGSDSAAGGDDDLDMDDPLAALARMAEDESGDDAPLSLEDDSAQQGDAEGEPAPEQSAVSEGGDVDDEALAALEEAAAEDTGEVEVILDDEDEDDETHPPRRGRGG